MRKNKKYAIKKLVLDFESMETLTIPVKHLHGIYFYGITKSWYADQDNGYIISKAKSCNSCWIYILHGMDTKETWYKHYMDFEDDNVNLLERLKMDDLTSVKIYFKNGSVEKIFVPWSDEDLPIPSVANAWQRLRYYKEKGYILLHVERNLPDNYRYSLEKDE